MHPPLFVRFLISLGIALALLAILLWLGDLQPSQLVAAVRNLPLSVYGTALAIHVGIYLVRALRFAVLLPTGQRPPFAGVFAASAAHNLAAYVLPAKTGEATLVVYLRGHSGVAASAGLASLVLSRLLDLATLTGIVGVLIWIARGRFEGSFATAAPALVAVLLTVSATVLAACLRPDLLALAAGSGARRAGLARTRIGLRILERLQTVAEALRTAARPGALATGLVTSAAIWALVFAFYAVLGRGAGLPPGLGFVDSAFGASLAVLFNLLPINGFAGFGTQEAGWQVGYELVGVDGALALSTGFAVHLAQLANVLVLGLLGHLALPFVSGPRRPSAE
ncbi:MAG: lysylphosphatidylglycerol synthase transmembrane domain-containing protein [Planctomycetota bacterium]